MPATPNQADGNRGKKQCDYFRYPTQALFAHPAGKSLRVAERDRDQCQIYQKRDQRKKQPDGIDQDQKGGKQCRPSNQRHPQRNNSEFVATTAIVWSEPEQFSPRQAKQDQTAGDLKIRHGNSECRKNNLTEKNKTDCHAKSGEDSQIPLSFSIFARGAGAKAHEDRNEPDWIDGNKDRNKSEEKFLDHTGWPAFSLYRQSLLHNVRSLHQQTFRYEMPVSINLLSCSSSSSTCRSFRH